MRRCRSPALPSLLDEGALAAGVDRLRGADPVLGAVIDRIGLELLGDLRRGRPDDHLAVLMGAIIGQQVSTAAARAIYARLEMYFGGRPPTPQEILDADPEQMRVAVGLTRAKAAALRSLAEHVVDGSLRIDELARLPDEQIIEQITAVRGLGLWSAQIFLILHLHRPDVVAAGDLGIRRAVMHVYGLVDLPPQARVEEMAQVWRPDRTLACLFLWRSLELPPGPGPATLDARDGP